VSALLEAVHALVGEFRREGAPPPRELVLEDRAFDRLYADCAARASFVETTASGRARAEHVDRFRVLEVEIVRHRPPR
jgi:hypothetical protein